MSSTIDVTNTGELASSVRQHHVLLDVLMRDLSHKVDDKLQEVNTSNKYEHYHPEDAEYSVENESSLDDLALNNMTRFTEMEAKIAQKHGLKPLTKETVNKLLSLKGEIEAAGDNVSKELTNQYKNLELRGIDEAKYEDYVAEVQNVYNETIAHPESKTVQFALSDELFRIVTGSSEYREGGLVDGHVYPTALRQKWTETGLVVETARGAQVAKVVTNEKVFGSQIASAIDAHTRKGLEWRNNLIKNKIGSKFLFGIYGGLLLWIMWSKWIVVNERDINRQKIKFAYRVLDEDAPLTAKQLAMLETHLARTKKFYDEEDEDEDDDDDKDE